MRNLDPTLQTGLAAAVIEPVILVALTFRSKTEYCCTAGFNVTWNSQTYLGIGTLGNISAVQEGTEVRADGLTVSLSGIDKDILQECENDILPLAPAICWFCLMCQGQVVGIPYKFFSGVVDSPKTTFPPTGDATITLKLESRMALLNRPSQRRYTSADQHANGYADDTAFSWVEKLNDIALRFGD